jgi:hypothetical protein
MAPATENLGKKISHNVPAVWKLLAQQSESFGGPNKGFAKHRTEGTRPGPTI